MSVENNINYLKHEDSQYLKQHANNPVNWYPYGPEALEIAREKKKPIFLSIGYSSCHWCHVMASESFEDIETAKYLNENFINIKVDREELPDIDQYYQFVSQVVSGRGGWPLSVFLTEELKPYFCGTYFPKVGRDDIPSFMDVLTNLSGAYKEEREKVNENATQIMQAIKSPPKVEQKVDFQGHFPGAASILSVLKEIQDEKNGGYGGAPKFPQFAFYEFAVEQILEGMIPEELGKHILLSVEKMLMGGIYDHARGGIHRYSVDEKWLVPHFEKMLYDQAGLLKLLVKTSLIYPSPIILDAQMQTLEYLRNEMLSEKGYFHAAQDADSEGHEGLYFSFTHDEFKEIVTSDEDLADQFEDIKKWFGISEKGNFTQGLNVISLNHEFKETFYQPEAWNNVRKVRKLLLNERKGRIPPMTDNKGVSSWNFMLISSLVDVVQYSKIEIIKTNASKLLQDSLEAVHKTFIYEEDGIELSKIHTTTTRTGHVPLFEDYVFFCEAQLRVYELSANKVFKTNGLESLKYIFKSFFENDQVMTRALEYSDSHEYDNIHVPMYDQSFKSAFSTYILLIKKWKLVDNDLFEIEKGLSKVIDNLTHLSLQNPLGYGETLRALIYPEMAFKKISVPENWLRDNKLISLFTHFSSRFALDYHDKGENWEICNSSACEFKGNGFTEFESIFKQTNPES